MLGSLEIDQDGGPLQDSLKGEYDTNTIHFFTVNLIWKFRFTIGLINCIHNFLILGMSAINLQYQIFQFISDFIH